MQPLTSAENATLPLELLARDKTDKNKANYAKLVGAIKSSHAGKVAATLLKENPQGEFAMLWRNALAAEESISAVELGPSLADVLAVKDASEQTSIKKAAIYSAVLMQKHLVQAIETIVDEDKTVTHDKLAQDAEDAIAEPATLGVKLSPELVESCYAPIIQSGGKFNLKASAFSNEEKLHFGTITCSLGARYKSYCSNVGRTYVINPTKEQEKHYKVLLELQTEAINALRADATASSVMVAVQNRLRSKAPHLLGNLTKNCGFGTGLEFRESALQLNTKCEKRLRPGMAFNLALGLENLEQKSAKSARDKTYALFLADTVLISESGPAEVLSDKAPKAWADVSYQLNDDDDDAGAEAGGGRRGNVEILSQRTRGKSSGAAKHLETNEALASHQNELEEQLRLDALARLANDGGERAGPSEQQETPIAYRDPNAYPLSSATGGQLKTNQSFVDGKAEAVLLPINGRLVPFHVSTIKNVSKSEEGAWTFLRINFIAPGAVGVSPQLPPEAAGAAHFVKEISLKARVATNLNNSFRLIKELRKRVQQREKQIALEADLVVQDALQLIRTGKIHRLRDINIRPTLGGKKAPGVLELHSNGLRFQAARGEKLDLIFKNIKLAFFQPAEKEILVLMHFHLHHPIMMGKKKTKEVQFYVEVMEASYSLDNARRSGYDPDELEEEQRERQLRKRMNSEFQNFVKKIEDQAKDLEFDIPYRELGFYGTPPHNKSSCFIMPAVNALVELTEPPWFVVPLNDIEVAHFERVVYGLKNFDMVLVLKDFNQKPLQVNSIAMEHLDALKTWLDSCNIKFYEGTANLNWGQIMRHINEMGVTEFYDEGGWKFLNMQASDDDESDDPEDAESDFEPSSSEEEEEEDESDYEDEDSDESEGEESLDSDESEGKDWEEMEEEARESDRKRGNLDMEEEEARGKKKKKK